MSFNNCTFTGRLGRDPEQKTANSGMTIANFSIAVDDGYGDKKKTHWINCVAFDKTANAILQYMQKGSPILVSGKGTIEEWTDKEGQKRQGFKLVVNQWTFFESGGNAGQNSQQPQTAQQQPNTYQRPAATAPPAQIRKEEYEDDIPF